MSVMYDSYASVNGALVATTSARVSPLGEGVMFGRGLFETIKVIEGRLAFFSAHHARLTASCAAIGLPWSGSVAELRECCEGVLVANRRLDGGLKVMVLAEPGGCSVIVVTRGPLYTPEHYARGFRLNVQRDTVSRAGPAHKSTNYLANLLARQTAKERGADDALLVDAQGEVIEGAATNVFIVSDGQLLTPPLHKGALPGIARGEILKRWEDKGAREQQITRTMLDRAEEVFVTNALLGVMPVSAIDARMYPTENYAVTPRLMDDFARWQREQD